MRSSRFWKILDTKILLHNAKFDLLVLRAMGINVAGEIFDSLIAARLLTQDWQRIGLKGAFASFF